MTDLEIITQNENIISKAFKMVKVGSLRELYFIPLNDSRIDILANFRSWLMGKKFKV